MSIAEDLDAVGEALTAYGAPLLGFERRTHWSAEETLVRALPVARTDTTILRVLPVFIRDRMASLTWPMIFEHARELNVIRELGALLELTAALAGLPALARLANELWIAPSGVAEPFLPIPNRFARELAEARTPPAMRRWGFLINMDEEIFRSLLARHAA